jgi:hypothetical protein
MAELSAAARALRAWLDRWGRLSRESVFEEFCLHRDYAAPEFRDALRQLEAVGAVRQVGDILELVA